MSSVSPEDDNHTLGAVENKTRIRKGMIISIMLGVLLAVSFSAFITILIIHLKVRVCDQHDCQNGTCEADKTRARGYKCNCIEGYVGDNCQDKLPIDCRDICENGPYKSGVYKIYPERDSLLPVRAFCDMETQGGGWTAIQKRVIGSVDFNRSWDEFKNPFGNPEEDYWIGNDPIQQLTKGNDSSLYVSMTLVNGSTLYELYDRFSVSDEAEKYRLFLGGPASGTLGDRMLLPNDKINNLNGMYFTTWDRDNDRHPGHCVFRHGGSGWWYNHCHDACLNGPWDSEIWEQPWDPPIGYGTEVRGTLMMVRRD